MAYNRRYNPDALPAHAEPETRPSASSHSSRRNDDSAYATRPPPPAPSSNASSSAARNNRYDAPPPRTNSYNATYDSTSSSSRYRDDRRPLPPHQSSGSRYDSEPTRTNSYSSGAGSRYDQGYAPTRQNPAMSRPPATPALPKDGNDREALWPMFRAVDKDKNGTLSERELGAALVNGDYTSFDPHTVRMMIRMFDVDRSGTIDFEEFCGLWGFLSDWRKLFDHFDVDRSGGISYDEFRSALRDFGYKLSPEYVSLLFDTYDSRGRGTLSFDMFVQACISLKRMTDVFKKYDTDRDGFITLSFSSE